VSDYIKTLSIKTKNIILEIVLDKKSAPLESSLRKVITNVLIDLTNSGYKLNLSIKSENLGFQK